MLRVLLEKGHVTREKKGKAYFYQAKSAAPTEFKKMTSRLADIFFGGSSFELIAQLIKTEKLSEEDVRQLQELAKQKAADSQPSKSKRKKGQS